MRWFKILTVVLCGICFNAEAASGKISKVLIHYLDAKGRHALSPSLYDRDAYQAQLRKSPEVCSALRFGIHWKAKVAGTSNLKLRMEIRGSKEARPFILEQPVKPNRWPNRWASLTLPREDWQRVGEIISWRATLWDGEQLLGEQKSFLW